MSLRIRRPLALPVSFVLACLGTGCPDDTPGDGTTTDASTGGSSGTTTMTTAPSTTTPMTGDDTGTSTGADSSSGPGPDSSSDGGSSSSGEPVGPEIEVSIEKTPVAAGDSFDIVETVDVAAVGTPVTVTIDNVGTADLAVGGVTVTAGDDAHFTVDTAMLDAVVAPAGSTSFTVTFEPTNGGLKELTLSIDNDDADEAPYELTLGAHTTPNTYRVLAPMAAPSARFNATMVDLGDGRAMLFGGRDQLGDRLADTWIYDVEAGTWTEVATMGAPSNRDTYAMAYDGGGSVILYGGFDGVVAIGGTWAYDVAAETWTDLAPAMSPPPLFQAEMVAVAPDTYVLFGGRDDGFVQQNQTWIYDAVANTWSDAAPADSPPARYNYVMAFDGAGTITIFGGYDINAVLPLGDTWRYDVAGNTWTAASPTTTPGAWFGQAGTHYGDGSLIVHSGKAFTCCDDPAPGTWAYDPSVDDWAELTPASEPTPRFNAAIAYVEGQNKSIIFGGNLINFGTGGANGDTIEYVAPRP